MLRLAAVAACLAVLTACASADDAAAPVPASSPVEPSTTASETSAPTPTEAPPVMPVEAQAQDVDGAAAFIRFYFEAMNHAYATGDLRAVASVTAEDCAICEELETEVTDVYGDEGHIEGGLASVVDVVVTPGDLSTGADARAVLDVTAGRHRDVDGSTSSEYEARDDLLVTVLLQWTSTGWRMAEWGSTDAAP